MKLKSPLRELFSTNDELPQMMERAESTQTHFLNEKNLQQYLDI